MNVRKHEGAVPARVKEAFALIDGGNHSAARSATVCGRLHLIRREGDILKVAVETFLDQNQRKIGVRWTFNLTSPTTVRISKNL